MKMKQILRVMLSVAAAGIFMASGAQAAITGTGDVEPANPGSWTSSTSGVVGNTANGSLTVAGGSVLTSRLGYLGNNSGVTGTVVVDGSSSVWNNALHINVGNSGNGALSITNGGSVVNGWNVMLGYNPTGSGTVKVDGGGSSMSLNASQSLLVVGSDGTGSLAITNGGSVTNNGMSTNIGFYSDGTGSIVVDGKGSTLSTTALDIADQGTGSLTIRNGGRVTTSDVVYVAASFGQAVGSITVDGPGSKFNTTGQYMYLGDGGSATLKISNGGTVNGGPQIYADSGSLIAIDVANGSSLTTDNLQYFSGGTVRLSAGAGAASGTYTPLKAGVLSTDGSGNFQVLGGVWNATTQTVTVSNAITTTAGKSASMDLYTNQRGIVTDPSTGKSVGLGFQATATSNPITFSATAIGGSELSSLQSLIGTGKSVLSGWSIGNTGTTISSTNPVYLSLTAGTGQSLASLAVYDFNGTSWSLLTPADLAYDGNYASFTAYNLNDIAVAGTATPTPIPAAVWLLGSGLFGLFGLKRKQHLTV
jgi:T5SS/PEP-CTERM-associated repeat protein